MLVIIGKTPPPIGGLSIHVERLLDYLSIQKANFDYLDITLANISRAICKYKSLHLHTSSPYVRFIFALAGFVFSRRTIITYHGNIGRFNIIKNAFDLISIYLCTWPIVINQESYEKVIKYNPQVRWFSAFIPPTRPLFDNSTVLNMLKLEVLVKYKYIFCTNAYRFARDKNGKELYGICDLISIFLKNPEIALIISDPSEEYSNYFTSETLPDNVYIISEPHDFYRIIQLSDCLIRATTTDGDSLSIKEALFFDKDVIASNCVSRPEGVILYQSNDISELEEAIVNFKRANNKNYREANGALELKTFYNQIL